MSVKLDPKTEERHFIIECIRVYKSLPCLWKVKSEDYNDRLKKNEAYDILVKKYQEKHPEADRDFVKKKINSLRTNYRKELKKIANSMRLGQNIYESALWYFQEMSFLKDQNPPTSFVDPMMKIEAEDISISDEEDNILSTSKRKPQENDFAVLTSKRPRENDNEYINIALVWAAELQKMDPTQRIFAKKAINDILYEGQLGTLHRHAVQINVVALSGQSTPQSLQ